MDGLLSEISTTKRTSQAPPRVEVLENQEGQNKTPQTLDDATQVLREVPDFRSVQDVMHFVESTPDVLKTTRQPSPKTTPFFAVLINEVLPNFWRQIPDGIPTTRSTISHILQGLPALNALVGRLKTLIREAQDKRAVTKAGFLSDRIIVTIDILELMLSSHDTISSIWQDIAEVDISAQQDLLRAELIQVFATSRIISTVSQAQDVVKNDIKTRDLSWLGNGKEYTAWLGRSAAILARRLDESQRGADRSFSQLIIKAMSIGYAGKCLILEVMIIANNAQDHFLTVFIGECAKDGFKAIDVMRRLMKNLKAYEKRSFFTDILRVLDARFSILDVREDLSPSRVGDLAAIIRDLITESDEVSEHLIDLLIRSESLSWIMSLSMRKAAILALAEHHATLDTILDRALERFADQLFVIHGPVLHQEAVSQGLLISAGLINRKQPSRLRVYAKSARFMNSISLHLKSNSPRIRTLGMIVGSGISSLVDDEERKLKFDDASLNASEAKTYLELLSCTSVVSPNGNLEFLFKPLTEAIPVSRAPAKQTLQVRHKDNSRRQVQAVRSKTVTVSKIVELEDDDDLVPYAKPDSDPDDDDEDPTLVNRDKPRPPVYIRDLLVGLRDTEDYDKHRVALVTAATLVRRKAGFGTEVKDHIQELASILMNLNNSFEFEDFVQLREEALIAVLIADPTPVAQYYAKSVFEGDFSIQQRTSILAAIGLGARELAAFKDDERTETPSFPSKELPDHLRRAYDEDSSALSRVVVRVQRSATEPLALKAADEMTGPNALKVRTFSSRITKEKTRRRPAANELAKIVGGAFFFPLTARWWTHARASSQGSTSSPFASPILLPVYLRTLAIILHAAGSWALTLPQMTAEYWSILLAVRGAALGAREYQVLEALLFGLLILLEVNMENSEGIARDRSHELFETQEWCKTVLGEISEGDQESNQIRSLAASVIMRCQEVIERWQRLMVGNMIDL